MNANLKNHILALAVVVVALNLRPVLAAVGPVLDEIQALLGMSHTQASLLTTIPVFLMGAGALCMSLYSGRLNTRIVISVSICLITVACAARYTFTGGWGLLITSALAGIGIASIQTLLPGFIKAKFASLSGNILGLYSTAIMGGAAVAAAASAGLVDLLNLPLGLAVWALPALVSLLFWVGASQEKCRTEPSLHIARSAQRHALYQNTRAWSLMLFFGVGTGAYTLVLAWLPPFYTSLGWSASQAGLLLAGVTLAEVAAGFCVAMLVHKFLDRRWLLVAVLLILLAGLVCLILAPIALVIPICLALGLGIGALFPLSLIVTADHIEDPVELGKLMAFVQGGGYIVASFMPLLAGLIRDRFDTLAHAWTVMAIGVLLLLMLSVRFSPSSYRSILGRTPSE